MQAKAALATGLQFRFIGFDAREFTPAQLKSLAVQTQPYGIGVAFNVFDATTFQACLNDGVNAAASWFFKRPSGTPAKSLNPAQAQIVRVLNLVRKNADVKEIEAAPEMWHFPTSCCVTSIQQVLDCRARFSPSAMP